MPDTSARFRLVAFVIGLSFIGLPFFAIDDDVHLLTLIFSPVLGAIFVAYGIGGPSLLKKIGLTHLVETRKRRTSFLTECLSVLGVLMVALALGLYSYFFEPEVGARKFRLPVFLALFALIAFVVGLYKRSQKGSAEDPATDSPDAAPDPTADPETTDPTPVEDE